MKQKLFNIDFKNPIIAASGPWGFLHEWKDTFDLNILGAATLKTTTPLLRHGNETPRMTEVVSGLLNSIGLANPGIDLVIKEEIPKLSHLHLPIIGNVGGFSIEDYRQMVLAYDQCSKVAMIEVNVSCPNVKHGNLNFAHDEGLLCELVHEIRSQTNKALIIKLSPNLPSLVGLAKKMETLKVDGLTVANTYVGMKIDLKTKKPILANKTGGLSGPAIKALTMRHVFEVAQATTLPIIALGGVQTVDDVMEYVLAGASLVGIGSTVLHDPQTIESIVQNLPQDILNYKGLAWKS